MPKPQKNKLKQNTEFLDFWDNGIFMPFISFKIKNKKQQIPKKINDCMWCDICERIKKTKSQKINGIFVCKKCLKKVKI